MFYHPVYSGIVLNLTADAKIQEKMSLHFSETFCIIRYFIYT